MPYEPSEAAINGRRTLGQELRRLRREHGLTQEKLALSGGLDRSFYVEVEQGRHSLTLDRLCDLAEALNVSPADLLTESAEHKD